MPGPFDTLMVTPSKESLATELLDVVAELSKCLLAETDSKTFKSTGRDSEDSTQPELLADPADHSTSDTLMVILRTLCHVPESEDVLVDNNQLAETAWLDWRLTTRRRDDTTQDESVLMMDHSSASATVTEIARTESTADKSADVSAHNVNFQLVPTTEKLKLTGRAEADGTLDECAQPSEMAD